ncbi:hypothetical protein CEXT_712391 [Caerostris extrusa]|uniref:Uncharacterized protein n=1 Tax=Caerostris extrusa TaxID=172846 RepID=A0AAV4VQ76_CAEEX|nr:hypothetical protein CEXT_712391 [Caerostris extrusa]
MRWIKTLIETGVIVGWNHRFVMHVLLPIFVGGDSSARAMSIHFDIEMSLKIKRGELRCIAPGKEIQVPIAACASVREDRFWQSPGIPKHTFSLSGITPSQRSTKKTSKQTLAINRGKKKSCISISWHRIALECSRESFRSNINLESFNGALISWCSPCCESKHHDQAELNGSPEGLGSARCCRGTLGGKSVG